MKKKLFIAGIIVAFGICFYGACNRLNQPDFIIEHSEIK